MNLDISFFINSILLGIGLAMDAFSVSLADGLNNPKIKFGKTLSIAGVFAFFQALMPLLGFFCVHMFLSVFKSLEKFIPLIALLLLSYIGIKMLLEGIRPKDDDTKAEKLTFATLIVQGIATSIDALSVGFTISNYNVPAAFICALLIAAITFPICIAGVLIGKKIGNRYASRAAILGGCILIFIGIEIFVSSL